MRIPFVLLLMSATATCAAPPPPPSRPREFIAGADVSMLTEIEKAGGVFRRDGKSGDALEIMRAGGCNLFRVRLFVDPEKDFNKNHGATQDLPYVVALTKRIKASGATLLLDLHYSDTWADPAKQFKPKAWESLDFDALEKQVHDYTASVLKALADAGATPDMVQIGNEIAGGMLWPDGKVLNAPKEQEAQQWKRFARLLNAGARAVREAAKASQQPIRVVIHIHGGGKPGLPKWFFEKLAQHGPVDFDIVALSFYPAWDDSLDALRKNLDDNANAIGKDILIAETSYPWRPMEGHADKRTMTWPQTREGQQKFVTDLSDAIRATPNNRGLGFVWWYPEAIPLEGRRIWRGGAEALFDEKGAALPALDTFGEVVRAAQ
jgi:arabinogalactan endo-1,4-beta-galactosidase